MTRSHLVALYEPDGTLLADGMVTMPADQHGDLATVSVRGMPGRLVQRCLLGGLREVIVRFAEGSAVPARVERVFFDPILGRACAVRLAA